MVKHLIVFNTADEAVIDVYHNHLVRVQFANEVFRPLAVRRLTTDFRVVFEAEARRDSIGSQR